MTVMIQNSIGVKDSFFVIFLITKAAQTIKTEIPNPNATHV